MRCTKCGYQENITRRCPYCRTVTMEEQALTEDVVEGVMEKLSNQSHEFAGSYCDWVDIDDVKDILMQLVKGEEDE